MLILLILVAALVVLGVGGSWYSRWLARQWGEDAARATPAVTHADGRDYVPTPTPVVFAHHFASIAGAGPIIGPVIALCFGWLPGLLWILFGGTLLGALHDYLATFISLRSGGRSLAAVAREELGAGPFLAMAGFLVLVLALVCATFLNLSAAALVSMVPHARLALPAGQHWFRCVGSGAEQQVVIGGIASTSVIVITMLAPLVGWLYLRRRAPVWQCSLLAMVICAVSIAAGLNWPVTLSATVWKLTLAGYVLIAAGLPVWIFLQSRDFINVHLLYAGLAALVAMLLVAAVRAGGLPADDPIPAFAPATGGKALGWLWPGLFITIACGAISGFHGLCAGGTTAKQLRSEPAARQVGYWAMLLESLLAVCVVAVVMIGATRTGYLADVHPKLLGLDTPANPILGFAMAAGNAGRLAFGLPIAIGALSGMIMLEGFLVTTLDTAVRLMRYLLEEIWRTLFRMPTTESAADQEHVGADGLGTGLDLKDTPLTAAPSLPGRILAHYWVNSALAVGLTLGFAMSAGIMMLWGIFATANQLLATFALGLGMLWLRRQGKRTWYVAAAAGFMLATTGASLVLLINKFRPGGAAPNPALFAAGLALLALSLYLGFTGLRTALTSRSSAPQPAGP